MIAKAIEIAARIHNGQVDKAGEPYILHCLKVMELTRDKVYGLYGNNAPEFMHQAMAVAALHDTVEDQGGTHADAIRLLDEIERECGSRVVAGVKAMTHHSNEDYLAVYIPRVAQNPLATIVKICDLTHNLDARRMPANEIGEKELNRWIKYRKALLILERN